MKFCHLLLPGLILTSIAQAASSSTDGMFKRLDRDKDQALSQTEFAWAMGEKTPTHMGFTKRTYREFFRADVDQSNTLTRSEFSDWVRKPRRDLPAELVERFFIVDRNDDEMLDAKELAKLYRPTMKRTEAASEVARLDANADGKLTRRECFRYLPVDCSTLLGMSVADAQTLLSDVSVSAFIWREGDIAYPYDPVRDEVQPLFFWGVDAGIITDCTLRINLRALHAQSPQDEIATAMNHGLVAARPSVRRLVICYTNFGELSLYPRPLLSADGQLLTIAPHICPPYEELGLPAARNFGIELPAALFLEIGSYQGRVEVLSLTRGAAPMAVTQ